MRTSTQRIKASGQLRHSIELQTDGGSSQDSFGAETKSWSTSLTTWANVDSVPMTRGGEATRGQQVVGEVTHKITIRYWSSLTRKHRVKFGTRYFDINSIRNVNEQGVFQELYCKEAT